MYCSDLQCQPRNSIPDNQLDKPSGDQEEVWKTTEDLSTAGQHRLWEVKKNPSATSAALQRAISELQEVSTGTIRHRLCNDLKLPAKKLERSPSSPSRCDSRGWPSASCTKTGPWSNGRRSFLVTSPNSSNSRRNPYLCAILLDLQLSPHATPHPL